MKRMGSMPSIGDVMTRTPVMVEIDATVVEAQDLMVDHEIRHLPVVDTGQLVGVVSDRDIAALENDADASDLTARIKVREVCSLDHYSLAPDAPLDAVLMHMAEHRIGSVVVTEAEKVVGVFTATDACRVFAIHLREPRG
jgi:acetoin utilization protein AcuB